MRTIKLVEPKRDHASMIWEFRQEVLESNEKDAFAGCGNLKSSLSALDWIEEVQSGNKASTCPPDKVPSHIYLAIREEDVRLVGMIDLRHHINHPILSEWGGHIGYMVRPSERRKGYAKTMLKESLVHAKALGLSQVLITCDISNVASEKTILANYGVFERLIEGDGRVLKRYWITL